jgi:hypothetical protein
MSSSNMSPNSSAIANAQHFQRSLLLRGLINDSDVISLADGTLGEGNNAITTLSATAKSHVLVNILRTLNDLSIQAATETFGLLSVVSVPRLRFFDQFRSSASFPRALDKRVQHTVSTTQPQFQKSQRHSSPSLS